ncbi:hypothetical protein D3C75_1207890 [compost metagenome]
MSFIHKNLIDIELSVAGFAPVLEDAFIFDVDIVVYRLQHTAAMPFVVGEISFIRAVGELLLT